MKSHAPMRTKLPSLVVPPLVGLACLLAVGCGSTQPAKFYLLNDTPSVVNQGTGTNGLTLLVGPINLPPHLERSQITRSTDGTEVIYEEYHRWAEGLGAGIMRVLRAELASELPDAVVMPFAWVRSAPYDYRVPVSILAFSGIPGKEAHLSAQWAFTAERGRNALVTRTSTFTTTPEGDGYEGLVQAQSDLIKELGREIVQTLRDLADRETGE